MLFKNKIEYTKGMFVEIYGTEIKKVRLVLRIITGIAVVAAIAFMIYGAAARGFIMPGDFFNLGISLRTSVYVSAESDGTFTDEKMQKERTPWRTYPSFY